MNFEMIELYRQFLPEVVLDVEYLELEDFHGKRDFGRPEGINVAEVAWHILVTATTILNGKFVKARSNWGTLYALNDRTDIAFVKGDLPRYINEALDDFYYKLPKGHPLGSKAVQQRGTITQHFKIKQEVA